MRPVLPALAVYERWSRAAPLRTAPRISVPAVPVRRAARDLPAPAVRWFGSALGERYFARPLFANPFCARFFA